MSGKNLPEDYYQNVIGSIDKLRCGITTGTCAQAAVRAAFERIVSGSPCSWVRIRLPESGKGYSGRTVSIPVEKCESDSSDSASVYIKKDSGDDRDITNGTLIGASVKLFPGVGIEITGGTGVGTVTREGLPAKSGGPAINPVPMKMIRRVAEEMLPPGMGCRVEIIVPEGEALAKSTWNPRIGVKGGISIIGTKGVIEPRSEEAYMNSILALIKGRLSGDKNDLIITSGYVGEKFCRDRNIPDDRIVSAGDHLGFAILKAVESGAEKIMLIGHVGKLVKLAAGIFNTHWKSGDARLEVIAAYAGACGADQPLIKRILDCDLSEESIALVNEAGFGEAFNMICRKIIDKSQLLVRASGGSGGSAITGGAAASGEGSKSRKDSGDGKKSVEFGVILLSLDSEMVTSIPEGISDWGIMFPEVGDS